MRKTRPLTVHAGPAAVLIDAEATLVAAVPDPVAATPVAAFRDAVVARALDDEGSSVAGVLFASRWGGGGVTLT